MLKYFDLQKSGDGKNDMVSSLQDLSMCWKGKRDSRSTFSHPLPKRNFEEFNPRGLSAKTIVLQLYELLQASLLYFQHFRGTKD